MKFFIFPLDELLVLKRLKIKENSTIIDSQLGPTVLLST